MDKQNIIDKYVLNQLSVEEQQQFDNWLKTDPKFKSEVTFYQNLAAAAREKEKDTLKQQLEKRELKIANKGKRRLKKILLVSLGTLMLIAAFVGYRLEKMKKSPEGIYASHYEVYPNVYFPVTRGNTDVMTQAFTAYENGDFKTAAEMLDERIKTSSAVELQFYQAMSYAEMGNFPLAIGKLENMKRFGSDYLDEAYWYLGLFYLKQLNYNAAISHFQDFIELTTDAKKKAAAIDILGRIM